MADSSTLDDLLALLNRLRREEEAIMDEVKDRLADVQKRIVAVETTIELLPRGSEQYKTQPLASSTNGWAQKLRGLTQVQALVRMAQENDGIVSVRDARRVFMATGLARGKPKNVGPHLYHVLRNAEQFQRVAPGTFKLIQESEAGDTSVASLLTA
jgi:hypothetical protein